MAQHLARGTSGLASEMRSTGWCRRTTDLSIICTAASWAVLEPSHDAVPDTGPPPAGEAIVASRVGAILIRQITMWPMPGMLMMDLVNPEPK